MLATILICIHRTCTRQLQCSRHVDDLALSIAKRTTTIGLGERKADHLFCSRSSLYAPQDPFLYRGRSATIESHLREMDTGGRELACCTPRKITTQHSWPSDPDLGSARKASLQHRRLPRLDSCRLAVEDCCVPRTIQGSVVLWQDQHLRCRYA